MIAIKKLPPTKLTNRYVTWQKLTPYFYAESIEELLMKLREMQWQGLISFEVRIRKEYFEWQKNRVDLKLHNDVLNHLDPLGVLHKDQFGLGRILTGVDTKEPLSDDVAIEIVTALPPDVASRYIELKIYDIDRDRLKGQVPKENIRRRNYGEVSYKGLVVSDAEVTYFGDHIEMEFREQEALRIFLERPETLIPSSVFTSNPDIFKDSKFYPDPHKTCSQLISDLRRKLEPVVKQHCIYNTPSEGWRLRID